MSTWAQARSRRSATENLARVVAELTRARRLQYLLEHIWGGLFWALLLASAGVLAVRVSGSTQSLVLLVAAALLAGTVVAAFIAYLRRPEDLAVIIHADLKLNLRQQLSTAWEFALEQAGTPAAEQLAAQAVRARLPSRPELVFPLRFNVWGRLLPAAALLLVLMIIVELPSRDATQPGTADELLRSEGTRLREYGQRMETRARRDALTRSERESRQVQRLGSRMESGSLSRRQALSRLRQLKDALDEQRRSALGEGAQTKVGPLSVDTLETAPGSTMALGGMSARALLDKLLSGELRPADLQTLGDNPGALSPMGVPSDEVQQALQEFSQGDQRKLKEMLERIARKEQALEDARQLRDARRQVQQAEENLGDSGVGDDGGGADPAEAGMEGDDALGALPGADMLDGAEADGNYNSGRAGSGDGSEGINMGEADSRLPEPDQAAAILRPEGHFGEGEVFVSEARVLPRANEPTAAELELDPRFRAQLEEVLSKESYPMHQKAFVRRYFLNLSEGSEEPRP